MIATSVTPGSFSTSALLRTAFGVPLSVGGRQIIVGSAPGTSRSIANCFLPVTMSSASSRVCGLPSTLNSLEPLSLLGSSCTCLVVLDAAFVASSPYVAVLPFGAVTTPPLTMNRSAVPPSRMAAASSSCCLAIAAATRIGV